LGIYQLYLEFEKSLNLAPKQLTTAAFIHRHHSGVLGVLGLYFLCLLPTYTFYFDPSDKEAEKIQGPKKHALKLTRQK